MCCNPMLIQVLLKVEKSYITDQLNVISDSYFSLIFNILTYSVLYSYNSIYKQSL